MPHTMIATHNILAHTTWEKATDFLPGTNV